MTRRGSPVLSFVPLAAAAFAACGGSPAGGREANTFEFAYEYLAPALRSPEVCEKISPHAYLAASMSPRGHQVSYTKSDCYYNLALETNKADYCAKVVAAKTLLLDGSKVNEAECQREVAAGRGLQAVGGDIEWPMRFMGYVDADTGMAGWDGKYYAVLTSGELARRAAKLPDFSKAGGPVTAGVAYADLGCTSDDAGQWYCYAYRCLASTDEGYRQACFEVASYLQTRQREEAEGRKFPPSGHVRDLLTKYPALKTFPDA